MPWITLMHIPLAFVYYNLQRYYRHTSRDLKRIYAVSLSPLYAHFTETLQGLAVIRAMRAGHRWVSGEVWGKGSGRLSFLCILLKIEE